MKTFLIATAAILLACCVSAQEVNIQMVDANGTKKTQHRPDRPGINLLRISVQNVSSAPLTVSYIGAGSAAVLAKVPDRSLDAGREAFFPVAVDADALGVDSNVEVAVGYTVAGQLKVAHSILTLGSPDVLTFTPGYLSWKVGDAADEKVATISLPPGAKLASPPTADGFDIKIDGDKIRVRPLSTGTAAMTAVFFPTKPATAANRQVPLGLSIAP